MNLTEISYCIFCHLENITEQPCWVFSRIFLNTVSFRISRYRCSSLWILQEEKVYYCTDLLQDMQHAAIIEVYFHWALLHIIYLVCLAAVNETCK